MTRNILITIEYDGSAFRGWQVQREPASADLGESVSANAERVRTVQGTLEQALSHICGEAISLKGTSRTDAGVHALGQAASFRGNFGIPTDRIPTVINHLLEDVRVLTATDMPERFHARFDAKSKTYLYRIAAADDIFLRNYRYQLNESLDEGKMEQAAKHLVGTYDFAAFRTMGGAGQGGTVRTITDISVAGWDAADTKGKKIRETEIRVTGKSFMYNTVRIIAGTLIEVGRGVREPADMARILASKDRSVAGRTAPAAGLYLEKVYFE